MVKLKGGVVYVRNPAICQSITTNKNNQGPELTDGELRKFYGYKYFLQAKKLRSAVLMTIKLFSF